MEETYQQLFNAAEDLEREISTAKPADDGELEQFRIKYLGSKGLLKGMMAEMRHIPKESKRDYGLLVNRVKQAAENKYAQLEKALKEDGAVSRTAVDLSLPAGGVSIGAQHPLSLVQQQIVDIYSRIGFIVEEGPEIEDDWHNFTALNTPQHHPARDMQDTFYIQTDPDIVLRTHTSPVQARVMQRQKPPIKIIAPGRTYRNETISARAHCIFHQVEGLYIDEGVSFADLKQTLYYFSREMFGEDIDIRLRPSYFPFTEPSAELDITCLICKGEGCAICKKTGWVELGGCGMVDPNVLENCNIDSEKYTGFAFGCGIERIAMIKYRINDIRLFSENDIRFLKQFQSIIG